MKSKKTGLKVTALRRVRLGGVLASMCCLSSLVQAACNNNIPPTRPNARYEQVTGASPLGSEVRDKVTGLIWQRCVVGMVWDGTTCTGQPTRKKWTQALEAARTATLSAVPTATAWRVPNHVELFSLAERACAAPSINTHWFPATPPIQTWSSSPSADSRQDAWVVDFNIGTSVYAFPMTSEIPVVRLVRSGQ